MDRPMSEYIKMLGYARHLNIRVLKYHGLEVEFVPVIPTIANVTGATLGDEAMPTEDQLLYWSSGYEEEIAAKPPVE
jgi:hypothetical protein